jgi:transposase
MLARAAAAVKHANQLIRALIITAAVICADETPIRAGPGPKTRKRYLLVACTNLLTYYFLGDRSLASFAAFVFAAQRNSLMLRPLLRNLLHVSLPQLRPSLFVQDLLSVRAEDACLRIACQSQVRTGPTAHPR